MSYNYIHIDIVEYQYE